MWNRLKDYSLKSFIYAAERAASSRSDFTLANQMKIFNQTKQYENVLHLFDQYQKENSQPLSGVIITQALKACSQIADLHRGTTIHHLIPSNIKQDPYILTSLIHLYSKFL